jgi:CheY-like chemotaxis protein
MRILIVDDDEDTRETLGLILQAQGHVIEEAVDGRDALDRLRHGSHPSLILLDMMMPQLDGEGFMKAARASDCGIADAKVVIISGHQSVQQKAGELGASGYLVKPIDLSELLRTIEAVGTDMGERPQAT